MSAGGSKVVRDGAIPKNSSIRIRLSRLLGLEKEKKFMGLEKEKIFIGLEKEKKSMGLEKEKKFMEYIPLYNFVRLSEYRKAQNKNGSQDIGPEEYEDVETPLSPELCRDGASILSTGITPKELGIIQLGAQIMALFGEDFWWDLKERFDMHHRYSFLDSETDPRTQFFNWLVASYEGVFMRVRLDSRCSTESFLDVFSRCFPLDGVDTETAKAMIDLNAFVGGVDSFAYMDYDDYAAIMPRPQGHLDMLLNQYHDIQPDDRLPLPSSSKISLVELGIIKLTALFYARYGWAFREALMRKVVANPLFEFLYFRPAMMKTEVTKTLFMERTESRFRIFGMLSGAYARILRFNFRPKMRDVLNDFFRCLQLEKLEEGVERAILDLHAFVGGVDCFAYVTSGQYRATMEPPERLSVMMKGPPLGSQLTEYRARKKDECAAGKASPVIKTLLRFRFPARGITLKELGIIKLTAQFAARYGPGFMNCLRKTLDVDPRFETLQRPYDRWPPFFDQAVLSYSLVLNRKLKKSDACVAVVEFYLHCLQWEKLEKLEKGVETAATMTDLLAFAGGVDCFAQMDIVEHSANMPRPEGLSKMMSRLTQMQPDVLVRPPAGARLAEYDAQNQGVTHERAVDAQPDLEPPPPSTTRGSYVRHRCPEWTALMELGIMKLTALFVARYGSYFCWALMKKTVMKPQFKFMEPNDSKFSVYNGIVDAYEGVVKPLRDACTATALDAFFDRLQLEKLLEGSETAMIDLHAFLSGVDYFAHVEDDDFSTFMPHSAFYYLDGPSPYDQFACYPSMRMMQPSPPMPGMSPHPPLALPEEPQPKRQKWSLYVQDQDQELRSQCRRCGWQV